ncbi:MAG: nucleotidyltransferase family protein [Planctomycetes bacterium]|nr:nucleotidyltransferase family protein [Planctomycetota bacterium]MCB9917987.1 nucleotidyltransferase family protein [Planctomycetota bacterium]
MNIIVLAAGFAKRLWPLTKDRAKPLLEVGGRPVLDHLLERALRAVDILAKCDAITLVTNARFAGDFESWARKYDSRRSLHVVANDALEIDDARGALVDLALALEHTNEAPDGTMVLAGDNLIDFELVPHLRAHLRAGEGQATVLARRVAGVVPPARHGEIVVDRAFDASTHDEASRRTVTRFREKPREPESDLVATAIYFFPPSLVDELRVFLEVIPTNDPRRDAPGHFLANWAARGLLGATLIEGRLFDIGNLEALEAARAGYESNSDKSTRRPSDAAT